MYARLIAFAIHREKPNHKKWQYTDIIFNLQCNEHSSNAIKNLHKQKATGLQIAYFMPMHTFINILPYLPISGGFPIYGVSILDWCVFQVLVPIFLEVENNFFLPRILPLELFDIIWIISPLSLTFPNLVNFINKGISLTIAY